MLITLPTPAVQFKVKACNVDVTLLAEALAIVYGFVPVIPVPVRVAAAPDRVITTLSVGELEFWSCITTVLNGLEEVPNILCGAAPMMVGLTADKESGRGVL